MSSVLLKLDGRTESGGAPLVMHNERLADPLDAMTRALSEVSKKRGKTEADHMEMARREFYGGLYTEPAIADLDSVDGQKPIVPAWNILRSLQNGAKRHKRGKDVLRGVYPVANHAVLEYAGPQEAVALWLDGGFSLRKGVGVGTQRVVRTRPIFVDWQCHLEVSVDPNVFDLDTLAVLFRDAGLYEGLCEMRPVYGRYIGTVEEKP